jgi:type VI secretion system protein ImpG
MDERLLDLYSKELRHLREMAGEFARDFPKIAGRLSLDKDAKEICPDPYVERLLEGFAWLAARIHLKMDSEFPRFTQSLLETVYPHYLSPVPSMAVVRFDPDEQESALAEGLVIPRGTLLRSQIGKGERTACTFQTAHDVRLLPLRLVESRYFTTRDLAELNLPAGLPAKAAIRIRLQATAGVPVKSIQLDPLRIFIRGSDETPSLVFEQICARKTSLVLQSVQERGKTLAILDGSAVAHAGYRPEEAMLPTRARTFDGYRLLREYFAFPQRFLFFDIMDCADAVRTCAGDQIDLIIVLSSQEAHLEGSVNASSFELFCTPAINLFSKSIDRVALSNRFSEFHVVPDKNRPLDFEVFEIEQVTGYGELSGEEQSFRPFYLARDGDLSQGAFYTSNRVSRVLTAREKQFGKKSAYSGTEVFLSLVDSNSAPYRSDLRQLGIRALCTNRHLPIQMAVGVGRTDFSMDLNAPVVSIRCLSGPTVPAPSQAEGRFSWRLISHLSLNYLSLVNGEEAEGAAALRELLGLYVDQQSLKQLEGLRSVQSNPILRRVKAPGPIAFARGLEIIVEFDELAFVGTGVFILGAVLEQFFAKYVSLNSFTETVIKTLQRGEIIRWPAQKGRRPTI